MFEERRLLLKPGMISSPSLTRNTSSRRDLEVGSGREGISLRMKVQVGSNPRRAMRSLATIVATAADIGQIPQSLHDKERINYGIHAYWLENERHHREHAGVVCGIIQLRNDRRPLSEHHRLINGTGPRFVSMVSTQPNRASDTRLGFARTRELQLLHLSC